MAEIHQNRWLPGPEDFAARLEIADVAGFFSKKWTVEPGTRALFLQNGQPLGEAPPGQYTLETVADRLRFWTRKATTIILTSTQDVTLDLAFSEMPTRDLLVQLSLRLAVRLQDSALFLQNVMGSHSEVTTGDLRRLLMPAVEQAVYEAVGRLSIRDLAGEHARTDLENGVRTALAAGLARCGLAVGPVQTLSISHPEYDAQRRRSGATILHRLGLEHDKTQAKLEADRLFTKIETRERQDELEILARQVAEDRREGELAVLLRRLGIRKQWRAALLAGQMDKIQSAEELDRFLQERDKDHAIRQEEYEALLAALRDKAADGRSHRDHLLRKVAFEQQYDLDGLRIALDFARKKQTKELEIELASVADTEASRRWKANLERELEEAIRLRDDEIRQLEYARAAARLSRETQHEGELAGARNKLEVARLRGETDLHEAQVHRQVALVEIEIQKAKQDADFAEMQRRTDLKWKGYDAAIERREARRTARDERERKAEQQRHTLEMEKEKLAIERLEAHRGMTADELIAVSENASILADLEKARAARQAEAEVARAQQGSSAELARLNNQRLEDHKAVAQQANETLRQASQTHQATLDQFGKLADNLSRNLAPQPVSTLVVGPGGPAAVVGINKGPTGGTRVAVCTHCRAENHEHDRFCRQCGQGL
jgi:hypothetical protein